MKNNKLNPWIPENYENNDNFVKTKHHEIYRVNHANTNRLKNSHIVIALCASGCNHSKITKRENSCYLLSFQPN